MPQEVEPGHHGIIRVRAFVDFWNFQLSLNDKHGSDFHVDWQRMGPWLADNAKQLISPEGKDGDIRYDGLNVYLSFDPSADGAFRNWATNVLDRFAGVQVIAKERKPKGPPTCPACHEKIVTCPHCGVRIKSKVEKGIDTAIVTDMIRLAWEDAYDVAIIVSSDRDFIPAVEFLSQKGLRIIHAGMTVKSTMFGSIRLTGRDSEKFVNQVAHVRPKQAAKDAYMEGKSLAKQMRSKGYAEIKSR